MAVVDCCIDAQGVRADYDVMRRGSRFEI